MAQVDQSNTRIFPSGRGRKAGRVREDVRMETRSEWCDMERSQHTISDHEDGGRGRAMEYKWLLETRKCKE